MADEPTTNTPPAVGHKSTAVRIPLSMPGAEGPHAERSDSGAASAPADLASLDQQLSSDLDAMLQGNFDPIEKVLDEVFDEKAAIVQRVGSMPAEEYKSRQAASEVVAAKRPAEPPAPAAVVPAEPVVEPPVMKAAVTPVDPSSSPRSPSSALQPTQPNERTAHESAAPEAVARIEPTVASVETPTKRTRDVKHAKTIAEPALVPEVAASSAAKPTAIAARFTLPQPVVRLLVMVNLPFRRVARSKRSLLDWAALTLLAWTPIVWVLVLLNRGPSHADAAQAEDHADSALALHESSRIVDEPTTPDVVTNELPPADAPKKH
jgi:hypothetical protein